MLRCQRVPCCRDATAVLAGWAHRRFAALQVHRDVSTSNILLTPDPSDPRGFRAKLSDFGRGAAACFEHPGRPNTTLAANAAVRQPCVPPAAMVNQSINQLHLKSTGSQQGPYWWGSPPIERSPPIYLSFSAVCDDCMAVRRPAARPTNHPAHLNGAGTTEAWPAHLPNHTLPRPASPALPCPALPCQPLQACPPCCATARRTRPASSRAQWTSCPPKCLRAARFALIWICLDLALWVSRAGGGGGGGFARAWLRKKVFACVSL